MQNVRTVENRGSTMFVKMHLIGGKFGTSLQWLNDPHNIDKNPRIKIVRKVKV